MSEECTHDCSSCTSDCADRENASPESFREKLGEGSSVKKVIGVVSGKVGVGKSLVTGLLDSEFARKDKHTAILDADIPGPSIPRMFGIKERALSVPQGIIPLKTKLAI